MPARSHRLKVVYWNNQPTPYVVARFNAVIEHTDIDLEAWFDVEREPDRSWLLDPKNWKFPFRYLPRRKLMGRALPLPDRRMRQQRPDLLVIGIDRTAGAVGALVAQWISGRVAARVLPTFDTWEFPMIRRDLTKHFLYRALDGAKVSGQEAVDMAERYGLPRRRTWKVTQSVDLDLYNSARQFPPQEVLSHRRSIGIDDNSCVFLYVGRLWTGKGVDFLLSAFRLVQEVVPSSELLLVGDGEDEQRLRGLAGDLQKVRFSGFVQPDELPRWYAASDVLVFPTLGDPNGLVVEEAMAAGLPVVSTTHAGDIKLRIRDGETGFVVPAFDHTRLAERMIELAEDPELRRKMAAQAAVAAQRFSTLAYAKDFDRFAREIVELPPRRGPCPAVAAAAGFLVSSLARSS